MNGAGWQPDGTGFKGPCPLCSAGRRRAWARRYEGSRWAAGCPSCGARSRAILRALGIDAGRPGPHDPLAAVRRRAPSGAPSGTDYADWRREWSGATRTAIETELKHVATKEDLQKLKVWFLTAGLGAGSAGALLTWLARMVGE